MTEPEEDIPPPWSTPMITLENETAFLERLRLKALADEAADGDERLADSEAASAQAELGIIRACAGRTHGMASVNKRMVPGNNTRFLTFRPQ